MCYIYLLWSIAAAPLGQVLENVSLGDSVTVQTSQSAQSAFTQTWTVQPLTQLGSTVQPVVPRLHALYSVHCTEYCR